jgi:ankyrin repeat protein
MSSVFRSHFDNSQTPGIPTETRYVTQQHKSTNKHHPGIHIKPQISTQTEEEKEDENTYHLKRELAKLLFEDPKKLPKSINRNLKLNVKDLPKVNSSTKTKINVLHQLNQTKNSTQNLEDHFSKVIQLDEPQLNKSVEAQQVFKYLLAKANTKNQNTVPKQDFANKLHSLLNNGIKLQNTEKYTISPNLETETYKKLVHNINNSKLNVQNKLGLIHNIAQISAKNLNSELLEFLAQNNEIKHIIIDVADELKSLALNVEFDKKTTYYGSFKTKLSSYLGKLVDIAPEKFAKKDNFSLISSLLSSGNTDKIEKILNQDPSLKKHGFDAEEKLLLLNLSVSAHYGEVDTAKIVNTIINSGMKLTEVNQLRDLSIVSILKEKFFTDSQMTKEILASFSDQDLKQILSDKTLSKKHGLTSLDHLTNNLYLDAMVDRVTKANNIELISIFGESLLQDNDISNLHSLIDKNTNSMESKEKLLSILPKAYADITDDLGLNFSDRLVFYGNYEMILPAAKSGLKLSPEYPKLQFSYLNALEYQLINNILDEQGIVINENLEALIEAGFDLNYKDSNTGKSIISQALERVNFKSLKALASIGIKFSDKQKQEYLFQLTHQTRYKISFTEDDLEKYDQELKTFKKNFGNLNMQDEQGNTALMYALKNDEFDKAAILLKNGADSRIQNHNKLTAAHLIARHQPKKTIYKLLNAGLVFDNNLRNSNGNTALELYNKFHSVKLDNIEDINDHKKMYGTGESAFTKAYNSQDYAAMYKMLADQASKPESTNLSDKITGKPVALEFAKQVVRDVQNQSGNFFEREPSLETKKLLQAIKEDSEQTKKIYGTITNTGLLTALHLNAEKGNLTKKTYDTITEKNTGCITALHLAAEEGNLTKIRELLSNPESAKNLLNAKDPNGRNAIAYALNNPNDLSTDKILEVLKTLEIYSTNDNILDYSNKDSILGDLEYNMGSTNDILYIHLLEKLMLMGE